MEDIFEHFGDIFGGRFGGAAVSAELRADGAQRRQRRGSDLRIRVKLKLRRNCQRCHKDSAYPDLCGLPYCKGTGAGRWRGFYNLSAMPRLRRDFACPAVDFRPDGIAGHMSRLRRNGKTITTEMPPLHGEGVERRRLEISFTIPAAHPTDRCSLSRAKATPAHGGVNGDLLVVVEEVKDPELIRDGADVIYNLMLDIPTAALGGAVEVPTITGRARLTIPAGTQPGKVLRLRGKGLANPETGGRGDQLVNAWFTFPRNCPTPTAAPSRALKNSPNIKPSDDARNRIFSKLRHYFRIKTC